MRNSHLPRALPLFHAVLAAAAALLFVGGAGAAEKPVTAVLLFDGRIAAQAELDTLAAEAFAAHGARVELRRMHAGRAETAPFLRQHGLRREHAPLLLILDGPGPRARIARRIPLDGDEPGRSLRTMLAALRLPAPRLAPPPPGPVIVVAADGGAGEKPHLLAAAGVQSVREGARHVEPGGLLLYRLRLPEGLRSADLALEITGAYSVEWADGPRGPWNSLLDSHFSLGPAADAVRGFTRPVAGLTPVLEKLTGSLYLRVHGNGRGRNRLSLARIEVVALGPGEESGAGRWAAEAERLRREHLAALPPGAAAGTPISGTQGRQVVLSAERSPYLMTGDVLVPYGATLTVEPGVLVQVAGNHVLRIQGELVARGTPEKPIRFRPAAPRQPDDWKGIQFLPLPGREGGGRSVLEHCRVSNAAAVELVRFGGEISRSVFENCFSGVVLRDAGSARLHHNRFLRCQQGIVVDRGAGVVTENEWVDCMVGLSVAALPVDSEFRFRSNSITGCRVAAVSYLKHPSQPRPPLILANNHWVGTAPERMVGGGAGAAEVSFEPRLPAAPQGVGPGN